MLLKKCVLKPYTHARTQNGGQRWEGAHHRHRNCHRCGDAWEPQQNKIKSRRIIFQRAKHFHVDEAMGLIKYTTTNCCIYDSKLQHIGSRCMGNAQIYSTVTKTAPGCFSIRVDATQHNKCWTHSPTCTAVKMTVQRVCVKSGNRYDRLIDILVARNIILSYSHNRQQQLVFFSFLSSFGTFFQPFQHRYRTNFAEWIMI